MFLSFLPQKKLFLSEFCPPPQKKNLGSQKGLSLDNKKGVVVGGWMFYSDRVGFNRLSPRVPGLCGHSCSLDLV